MKSLPGGTVAAPKLSRGETGERSPGATSKCACGSAIGEPLRITCAVLHRTVSPPTPITRLMKSLVGSGGKTNTTTSPRWTGSKWNRYWPYGISPASGFEAENRVGHPQPVDDLVDEDVVADEQRRLHRARRNLVGLDEEGANDDREDERDDDRLAYSRSSEPCGLDGLAGRSGGVSPGPALRRLRGATVKPYSPTLSRARNASCGISTLPTCFIRFLPSFCFSSSLRLRVISPP